MTNANKAVSTAQSAVDAHKAAAEKLGQALSDMRAAADEAQKKAEDAGTVQASVQEAHDKVVAAIEALRDLTAQAEIDKSMYDALVEQYNQAVNTYSEALNAANALDGDISALAEAVQSAISAANGNFAYQTVSSDDTDSDSGSNPVHTGKEVGGTGDKAGSVDPQGGREEHANVTNLEDGNVPLAGHIGESNAGGKDLGAEMPAAQPEEAVNRLSAGAEGTGIRQLQADQNDTHAEVSAEELSAVELSDEAVPLAASAQSVKKTGGVIGTIAAAFGALLLLGKRRKDEEESK